MPAPSNPLIAVLREWVQKADNDLTAARQIQKLGKSAPTDTICFHAQQCVEKYLKAILVNQSIPFSKTHDIDVLMNLIPPKQRPSITFKECQEFATYAVVARYPMAGLTISPRQARSAVAAARRIRTEARRSLPKAALRKNK